MPFFLYIFLSILSAISFNDAQARSPSFPKFLEMWDIDHLLRKNSSWKTL